MVVIAPADGISTAMAMNSIKDYDGSVYMRLSRAVEPTVYSSMSVYQFGKANIIRKGTDLTLFGYGASIGNALIAATILAREGIEAQVVDMAFIKPFDREVIIEAANTTGNILTIEEQTVIGGLGSVIAEVLAEENIDARFKRLGIPDQYTLSGSYEDLQHYYRLDPVGISAEARKLLKRET